MSEEELQESFSWHAEEHIPFDIADVNLDYQLTGKSSESLQVLMAACKSDKIANVKQAIQLAGKQPVIIDVDAFAMQNCYEVNYQPQAGTGCSPVEYWCRDDEHQHPEWNSLSVCPRYFSRWQPIHQPAPERIRTHFEQAESVKRGGPLPEGIEPRPIQPIIETVSDILALEVRKTMDFYRATADEGDAGIQKILLAGGGSKLPGLAEYLAKRFEISVEVFDPFRQIEVDANKFDPDYMREIVPEMAVAVGLALRGVEA